MILLHICLKQICVRYLILLRNLLKVIKKSKFGALRFIASFVPSMYHVSMYTLYFMFQSNILTNLLKSLKWRWYHLMCHIILQHITKKVFQLSGKISSMYPVMQFDRWCPCLSFLCWGWLKQSDVLTITRAVKYTLFPNHLSADRLYCIKPNRKKKKLTIKTNKQEHCTSIRQTQNYSTVKSNYERNQKQWVNKAQ